MYMTNGQISTVPSGAAHQYRIGLAQGRFFQRRGGDGLGATVSGFQKTGIPLRRTSAANPGQASRTRGEDCLYRQAAGEFSHPPEATRWIYGQVSERSGDASSGSLSEKREAWLRSVPKDASSFATILIDYSKFCNLFCEFDLILDSF